MTVYYENTFNSSITPMSPQSAGNSWLTKQLLQLCERENVRVCSADSHMTDDTTGRYESLVGIHLSVGGEERPCQVQPVFLFVTELLPITERGSLTAQCDNDAYVHFFCGSRTTRMAYKCNAVNGVVCHTTAPVNTDFVVTHTAVFVTWAQLYSPCAPCPPRCTL